MSGPESVTDFDLTNRPAVTTALAPINLHDRLIPQAVFDLPQAETTDTDTMTYIPISTEPDEIDSKPPFDSSRFRDRLFGGFQFGTSIANVGDNTEKVILNTVDKIPRYSQYDMDKITREQKLLLQELASTSFLLGVAEDKEKTMTLQLESMKMKISEYSDVNGLNDTINTLRREKEEVVNLKNELEVEKHENLMKMQEFVNLLEEQSSLNQNLRNELKLMIIDQESCRNDMDNIVNQFRKDIKDLEDSKNEILAETQDLRESLKSKIMTSETDYSRYQQDMASQQEWYYSQISSKDVTISTLQENILLLEKNLLTQNQLYEKDVSVLHNTINEQNENQNKFYDHENKLQQQIVSLQELMDKSNDEFKSKLTGFMNALYVATSSSQTSYSSIVTFASALRGDSNSSAGYVSSC